MSEARFDLLYFFQKILYELYILGNLHYSCGMAPCHMAYNGGGHHIRQVLLHIRCEKGIIFGKYEQDFSVKICKVCRRAGSEINYIGNEPCHMKIKFQGVAFVYVRE